jgi:protocatechuate 4,5-dioxygenase alpha chain
MSDLAGIPGTPVFGGAEAQKGYALNKMCYSFNQAANRQAFKEDEDAYMARFGLTTQQK